MIKKLLFIIIIFLDLNLFSQFHCDDILYDEDTLVIINDELYSGYCVNFGKNGRIISKSYIGYGVLDSIVYFDKNGIIEAVEPYKKWIISGTLRCYYKSGVLKQSINYKNDKVSGLWREYYKNGKLKYEAEYINEFETKDNSYYTWTKKGIKYLHICTEKSREKRVGKLQINSNYSKCKKIKVKDIIQ